MGAIIGGAIAAVGAVGGSLIASSGAQSAAKTAAGAQQQAAALEQSRYNQTRTDLSPYNTAGQQTLSSLQAQPDITRNELGTAIQQQMQNLPGQMTQQELEQTPGYQFNLSQGTKALQNSAAIKGNGISGNAIRAGLQYATGLADSTYQNQFNNAQTRFSDYGQNVSNIYNKNQLTYNQLGNLANLGENAAAATGQQGAQLGIAQGNNIAGAGQSLGAGQVAGSNAIANGLNQFGSQVNTPQGQSALNGIIGSINNGGSSYSSLDPTNQSVAPNTWSAQPDSYYLPGGAGYQG